MISGLGLTDTLVVIASIIISIAIHEAMHGYAAHYLGDDTAKEAGRLTLNPLKHIDLYTTILLPIVMILIFHVPFLAAKPVPINLNRVKFREYGAAIVALAGPISNLLLAVLAAVILRVFISNISESVGLGIYYFVYINIAIFVFNMIPIPPLDGSRVLYAFAPESVQRIMYRIESLGFFVILIFLIVLLPVITPIVSYLDIHILNFLVGAT